MKMQRQVLGWSVDERDHSVVFFVPEDRPIPAFPAIVDDFRVIVRPTSLPDLQ
jgi:hypothetical protein